MGKTRNLDFGLKANLGGLGKQLGFLSGLGYAASLVEELMVTIKQEDKNDGALSDEVHDLKRDVLEQLSKLQHKRVIHDLTTHTWWLAGIGIVLFFLIFFLTVQIYDQSKEIDRLELSDWKYRALPRRITR